MDRMAVIHLQSAYRSFFYPPFFLLSTPLSYPSSTSSSHLSLPYISYFLSISSYLHLQMLSSKIEEQSRPVRRFPSKPLHTVCIRQLSPPFQPLAVEFTLSHQVSIICLAVGSLSHTAH